MPRNWTDDEKVEIQTLSDKGLSLKEIGAQFSVSDDTIRGVLRRKRGPEIEPRTTTDRLRALHEKFDREVPGRHASCPAWVVKKDAPALARPLASPERPCPDLSGRDENT